MRKVRRTSYGQTVQFTERLVLTLQLVLETPPQVRPLIPYIATFTVSISDFNDLGSTCCLTAFASRLFCVFAWECGVTKVLFGPLCGMPSVTWALYVHFQPPRRHQPPPSTAEPALSILRKRGQATMAKHVGVADESPTVINTTRDQAEAVCFSIFNRFFSFPIFDSMS